MERVMGKVLNGEWAWGVVEGSDGYFSLVTHR